MARRFYRNGPSTTLAASIGSTDTSIQVTDASGFPTLFPYTLILDWTEAVEEVVDVTASAGNTLTVTRGADSTTGFPHNSGAVVVHGTSARDADEANLHVNSTSAVHGVSGALVGTTDAQTLTSKTLTSPTINGGTIDAPAITSPTIDTPTITGGTATGLALTSPTVSGALVLPDTLEVQDRVGVGGAPGAAETLRVVPVALTDAGLVVDADASHTGDLLRLDLGGVAKLIIDINGRREPEAWNTIALPAGFQAREGLTPRYRRADSWVELDGAIEPDPPGELVAGGGLDLFTLPVGYRPTRQVRVAVATSLSGTGVSGATRLDIHTTGLVELWTQTQPIWVALTCRFPLD